MWIPVVLALAAALVALAAIVIVVNGRRFSHRVADEMRDLAAEADLPVPPDRDRIAALPPPVRRYLERALGEWRRPVRSVRLRHGGTFRPRLDGGWLPIHGEQALRAAPPAFVWHGRVRVAPGLAVDARDRCVDGRGHMFVSMASAVTLANASGPAIDQGALMRLLGELVWVPVALLDERHVRWTPLDDRRACATLRAGGTEVEGVFEFGEDGFPTRFLAERERDLGGGHSARTPFSGAYEDYRAVDGMLVPHIVEAAWIIRGERVPYARFVVEHIETGGAA